MKQTITVQVEIEFEGKYCNTDYCVFFEECECNLFYKQLKYAPDKTCKMVRCSQCIDACKENKDE